MRCGLIGQVCNAGLQIDVAVNVTYFTNYLHTWPGIVAKALPKIEKSVIRHKHQLSRLVRSPVGLQLIIRDAVIIGVFHITCYLA